MCACILWKIPEQDLLSCEPWHIVFKLIEARVTNICISKLTIIGWDNGCHLAGAKRLFEPVLEYLQLVP